MAEDKEKIITEEEQAAEAAAEESVEEAKAKETEETAEATESASDESKKDDDAESSEEAESERYLRLMAEFQNYKKRAQKEKSDIHAYANEKLVNELLPVLDNFERALETKTDEVESYAQGMQLIFEQMKTALSNHGLKEIAALGEDFDPNKHNAVMTEESEEYESGKVSKVLQKGYELNGKVVRPAMVAVVK